jgi:hypothetical protein
MEIVAARSFNLLYIYLDICWLFFFCGLLWRQGKRTALWVGLMAGAVYFLVDYGIFYLALGTRAVTGLDPLPLLFWMSYSYGVTNFAWIWLLLDRDHHRLEWSLLILSAWLAIALLSQNFGSSFPTLTTTRGTGSYHGAMAAILFAGYLWVILHNLNRPDTERIPILALLAIGIGVQFSWEFILLVSGIRPSGVLPLAINSLIETNLGMPYAYFIHKGLQQRSHRGSRPQD